MPPAFLMFHLASRVTRATVDLLSSVRAAWAGPIRAREQSSKVESFYNAHRMKLAGESIRKLQGDLMKARKTAKWTCPAASPHGWSPWPEQVSGIARNGRSGWPPPYRTRFSPDVPRLAVRSDQLVERELKRLRHLCEEDHQRRHDGGPGGDDEIL